MDVRKVILITMCVVLAIVCLYEHYGFKLKEEGKVPKSDVKHYAMRTE